MNPSTNFDFENPHILRYPAVEKPQDAKDNSWIERREVPPQKPEEAARAVAAARVQMQNITPEVDAQEEADEQDKDSEDIEDGVLKSLTFHTNIR
jgi:hypothetical protein